MCIYESFSFFVLVNGFILNSLYIFVSVSGLVTQHSFIFFFYVFFLSLIYFNQNERNICLEQMFYCVEIVDIMSVLSRLRVVVLNGHKTS